MEPIFNDTPRNGIKMGLKPFKTWCSFCIPGPFWLVKLLGGTSLSKCFWFSKHMNHCLAVSPIHTTARVLDHRLTMDCYSNDALPQYRSRCPWFQRAIALGIAPFYNPVRICIMTMHHHAAHRSFAASFFLGTWSTAKHQPIAVSKHLPGSRIFQRPNIVVSGCEQRDVGWLLVCPET